MHKSFPVIFLILTIFFFTYPGYAQTQTDQPIYIVQAGDTVGIIAQRFGIPVNDLIRENALSDPNAISIGMPLKIPGLTGIRGVLITQPVPLGETFWSLALRYQVTASTLARLNRITSPQELFAGSSLVLPQDKQKGVLQAESVIEDGQSMLEFSTIHNNNPWTTTFSQQNLSSFLVLPNVVLFGKLADPKNEIGAVSPLIKNIQINPLPLVQGETTVVRVQTAQPLVLTGKLAGNDLHFFPENDKSYVAIQGIYAIATPGLTTLSISGTTPDHKRFDFLGSMILKAGIYPNDPPLNVDPATIDPIVTKPEDDQIAQIIKSVSPVKYWTKKFRVPVDEPVCYKSTFGNRRSYNGGPYSSFHGGTDFGVCANLNIFAPADGVVIFAGPLSVRGNATIIDHGWGVLSGYWHQKEIKVKVGDKVKPGQLIGLIGATGRVTGPHLHWEIMINGIQVEPVDWLQNTYP